MKKNWFVLSLIAGTIAVTGCARGSQPTSPDALKAPVIQMLNDSTLVDLKQQSGTKVSMDLSSDAGRSIQAFKEDISKFCLDLYRGDTKLFSFEVKATCGRATVNLLNLAINQGYTLKIWAIDSAGQIVNHESETPKEVPIYLSKECRVLPLSALLKLKKNVVMDRDGGTNGLENIVTESGLLESVEREERDVGNSSTKGNVDPEQCLDDETHLDMACYLAGTLAADKKYIAFNEVKGVNEPEFLGFTTFSDAGDGLFVTIAGKTFKFDYAPNSMLIRAISYDDNTRDYIDLEDGGLETYFSTLYPDGIQAHRYYYVDQYGCINDFYFTDEGLVGLILTSHVGAPGAPNAVINIQRLH